MGRAWIFTFKRLKKNYNHLLRGDHDTLIAEKGQYYQLYTGAFELE